MEPVGTPNRSQVLLNGHGGPDALQQRYAAGDADIMPYEQRSNLYSKNLGAYRILFLCCLTICLTVMFFSTTWYAEQASLTVLLIRKDWIARAIAVGTMIMRTAVDIQIGIVATMLAAFFAESPSGMPIRESVEFAISRFCATPITLSFPITRSWQKIRKSPLNTLYAFLLIWILITTILLQLSSTVLFSDLAISGVAKEQQYTSGSSCLLIWLSH